MNLFVSLKYLVALDDHKHFGRAALASHVTQPALSNALRALEAHFSIAIVNRGRNFAGFTAEGERILVSARQILREHELLQQDLHSRSADPRGNLLIGAVPTAMPIAARFVAMLQDRHPGIVPTLRSMSSVELETGLENLALDMGLGYTERMDASRSLLRVVPQYTEYYFLLRRRVPQGPLTQPAPPGLTVPDSLQIGPAIDWVEAAKLPLCLLSPEMHNRRIVDRAFEQAGVQVTAAIETNSIWPLVLSVQAGRVGSIMPGGLVSAMPGYPELEALPLMNPQVAVPIAFMVHETNRPSRTLEAALALAQDDEWLQQAARYSGLLAGKP